MAFDVEKKLIHALQAQGVTLVKMETRNLCFQIQGEPGREQIEAAMAAAGYRYQPDTDPDGCYMEADDPEVVDGFIFAVICPDEDSGTFYLEFGGY